MHTRVGEERLQQLQRILSGSGKERRPTAFGPCCLLLFCRVLQECSTLAPQHSDWQAPVSRVDTCSSAP